MTVYIQADSVDSALPIFDLLRRGEIDFVTFTSPNIARAFLSGCDETIRNRARRGELRFVTNSRRTSEVLNSENVPVAAETLIPTGDAIIAALLELQHAQDRLQAL